MYNLTGPCCRQVGPRLSFSTAWAANAQSICQSCGLDKVQRIEVSRRYLLKSQSQLTPTDVATFSAMVRSRALHVFAFSSALFPALTEAAGQCNLAARGGDAFHARQGLCSKLDNPVLLRACLSCGRQMCQMKTACFCRYMTG